MNKKLFAILLIIAMLFGAGSVIVMSTSGVGGVKLLTGVEKEEYDLFRRKFAKSEQLLEYITENYYQPVDEAKLLEGSYYGMFDALEDQYSEYVEAKDSESFQNDMSMEYTGIGMVFFMNEEGLPEVESVYIDSPAEKAGIKAGDNVLRVDNEDIKDQDSTEIRDKVRGPVGTTVNLEMRRGDKVFVVSVKREKLSEITVACEKLAGEDIGYIQITGFGTSTASEFRTALTQMENEGVASLIIDLRNNGGGLVNSAIEVADMLMDKGTVVYAEYQDGSREYYNTEDGKTKLPYVLLVNEYTASASEILAAGVQGNNEGKIVGSKTFGKGIIQSAVQMSDGSILKITITQYFGPSGNKIHKEGITPDYVIDLTADDVEDVQLLKAIEVLK